MNKNATFFLAIVIFFLAFFYRWGNLNTPFWVDEFSSANQAKIILNHGWGIFQQKTDIIERNNYITHLIIALSFKIFGFSEVSARLPLVIAGSLVPVAIFFLGLTIFNLPTGLIASLLLTFSYFEITWSRQARGYVLQQLLAILAFIFYYQFIRGLRNKKKVAGFILLFTLVLGLLTHKLFIFVVLGLVLHFIFFYRQKLIVFLKMFWWLIIFLLFLVIGLEFFLGTFESIFNSIGSGFISWQNNNTWYYHSFLWRNYSLIIFLFLLGLFFGYKKHRQFLFLILIFIFFSFSFVNFFFFHYLSKYLLPIFPFLILIASFALGEISVLIIRLYWPFSKVKISFRILNLSLCFLLVMFIVVNGDQFSLQKKSFYSLNYSFREIALLDFNQIYALIKNKISQSDSEVVIIETWLDRPKWYLGQNYQPLYLFRWIDGGNPHKKTSYYLNNQGEKIIKAKMQFNFFDEKKSLGLIAEIGDLEKARVKYSQGFLWIDDDTLPSEVIDYAKNNLKLEMFVDHFEQDENPYSKWPAYLYSWGFE